MLGVGAIMMVVVQAESLDRPVIAALLIGGTLALALLVVNERRSREPIVPFALLRNRIIAAGNLGGLAIGALLTCVVGFLPTYVQGAMGGSPTTTGIVIAVLSVVWALASIVAGRLMVKTSYRLTGAVGALALICGCARLRSGGPSRPSAKRLWTVNQYQPSRRDSKRNSLSVGAADVTFW